MLLVFQLKAEKEQARLQRSPQPKRITGRGGRQSTGIAARRTGPSNATSATKPAGLPRSSGSQVARQKR